MTFEDIRALDDTLSRIESIDVASLLSETWPGQDLDAAQVGGGVTATSLLSRIKRIVVHMRNAIADDAQSLPRYFYHPDSVRLQVDLLSELTSLAHHIQARSWSEVSARCNVIVHCLVLAGYWSKTAKRAHAVYEKKAAELLGVAEAKIAELSTSIAALRTEKEELLRKVRDSKAELKEITDSLQTAKTQRQQLTDILTQSGKDQGKLSSSIENGLQNLRSAEKLITDSQAVFDDLDKAFKAAKDFYAKAHTDSQWMESKRKEIDDLVGKAADGSLGGTFRARKDELDKSVKTWRWVAFLATVLAAAYIPFAFLLIPSPQLSGGLVLLANLGKILPVVLFLGFVLRQYARERSFLEEYAFKTAVAFVVNAYADQLASERFEKTLADFSGDKAQWGAYLEKREAERKELIKDTVDRLFASPQVHAERAPSLVAFRPKAAADMLREARELLAEAKK